MKNKILTISIIFILFSCAFINNSFARCGDITIVNGYSYNTEFFNAQYQFVVLYNIAEDTLYGFLHTKTNHDLCETQRYYLYEDDTNFYLRARCDHYNDFQVQNCIKYDKSTDSFVNFSSYDLYFYMSFNKSEWKLVDIGCLVYRDADYTTLANLEEYDFFFQAPVTEITLAQALEKIQVQEMWKTLMKNVVISLLVFVVSYLALRKAWSFLRTQLKGS